MDARSLGRCEEEDSRGAQTEGLNLSTQTGHDGHDGPAALAHESLAAGLDRMHAFFHHHGIAGFESVKSRLAHQQTLAQGPRHTIESILGLNGARNPDRDYDDGVRPLSPGGGESNGKDIQAKWKHLRDNFRREYQAQKNVTSGQGAKKRKKYRYYDELLFLVPHVKDAITSGNYSFPTNLSEQNTESPLTPNIENSPAGSSTDTRNVSVNPKKKKKTTSSFEDEILKAINKEMSETDEDKSFCLSLVQSLKKMDDDTKMLAKIEILNVIRTFSNRSHNTYIIQPKQSSLNRPNIEPYFSHLNSNLSLQSTPIYTQTTQQQHSQPTSTQALHVYQQPGTTFIYTQTPQQQYSQPTFTQARDMYQQHSESHPKPSLHQSSSVNSVNPSKVIQILENRQYRPANSTAQSSRPHSAQSFFPIFSPNSCPSPSNTHPSSSTTVHSPLINITSPEEFYLSPDDI